MFATPADVETAFYEAIERGDLEAMMALWAEDDEIACITPNGPRMTGYAAVREAWRRTFDGHRHLQIRATRQGTIQNPFTAIHHLIEEIVVDDQGQTVTILVTNIFVRNPLGWRLAVHHASVAPADYLVEAPKTLH